jgi:hypothetical protein
MRKEPVKSYGVRLLLVGFVLALTAAAAAVDAPPLTFRFSTANVPGAVQTDPGGISNTGVTVGTYQDKAQVWHGYILNGKNLTRLDHAHSTETVCFNVNFNGPITVVGFYYDSSSGKPVGFLYKNGRFVDIPGPAGTLMSYATGINDHGEIVGTYFDSNYGEHGFLLKGTTYTTLDVPGAVVTVGSGINDRGGVVLYWVDSKGATESSLYNGKTYKTINVPGAAQSEAWALNNDGDISYEWFDSMNLAHGALLHASKYYKFDYPKSVQTYPGGINDRHVITGTYQTNINGPFQGFKVTYK